MNETGRLIFEFEGFRINIRERILTAPSGDRVLLPEKAFETLAVLVRKAGQLVEKSELLDTVWPGSFVEENNLNKTIHILRKTLGEDTEAQRFIETVRKHGYRFVAEVREVFDDGLLTSESTPAEEFIADLQISPASASAEDREPSTFPRSNVRPIWLLTFGTAAAVTLVAILGIAFLQPEKPFAGKDKTSIAVLPVKPIASANHDEIYEMGIAESLIHRLSVIKGFVVRPLNATRKYSGVEQDALTAGREQKVDYVLALNYQLADGKIRVTAQLFNVVSGQIEETFKIEKNAANIFAMQDAVASEVGAILQARFAAASSGQVVKRGTDNEEAYRLYLQGTALADKHHQKDVRKAIDYFEQAILLDPNYALAYAKLANAQTAMVSNGGEESREQYHIAKAAIEKAVTIDQTLAESHSYLGEIKSYFEWNFAEAEREHRIAISLAPHSSAAHRIYALMLNSVGRHDESIAEIKTAIDLEPASVLNQLVFGRILLFARRYDQAIIQLERVTEMETDRFFAYQSLSVVYRLNGDDDKAFESLMKAWTLSRNDPDRIDSWKTTYAESGWKGVLERQLEEARAKEKKGEPNFGQLLNLTSELGQREEAFTYLEKSIEQGKSMSLLKVHPRFDPLRSDPRFDEMLRRVGF